MNVDVSTSLEILVLNWNKSEMTRSLLSQIDEAFVEAGSPQGISVHVLDNGSELPLTTPLVTHIPCRLTSLASNIGYSGGMHRLVSESTAEIVWLLNNDCEMPPSTVKDVLSAVASHQNPSRLLIFPLIEDPDGTIQSRDCTWNLLLGWRTNPYSGLDVIFGDKFVSPILSRKLAVDLELFPPFFHTYGEDFDASYALAKAGVPANRAKNVRIGHQLSSSRPVDVKVRTLFRIRGAANYLTSALINYSRPSLLIAFPALLLKIWIFDLLVRGRNDILAARGLREWLSVPKLLWQRRAQIANIRQSRSIHWKLTDTEVSRVGSV